jgi:hypothetical protein
VSRRRQTRRKKLVAAVLAGSKRRKKPLLLLRRWAFKSLSQLRSALWQLRKASQHLPLVRTLQRIAKGDLSASAYHLNSHSLDSPEPEENTNPIITVDGIVLSSDPSEWPEPEEFEELLRQAQLPKGRKRKTRRSLVKRKMKQ